MSLLDLVAFAQSKISHGDLSNDRASPPWPPTGVEPPSLPEGENANLTGERPPHPGWLGNTENEISPLAGLDSQIFDEGELASPVAPLPGSASPHGVDVLAYYLPYHFYGKKVWGIYLRATGILELAASIKGSVVSRGDDDAVRASTRVLFNHEFFHCHTEAAATRAEVVVRDAVYRHYFHDRHAAEREEAMANAAAYRLLEKSFPVFAKAVREWMIRQGPGYRRFGDYGASKDFHKGKRQCSQHIVRFVPSRFDDPLASACRQAGTLPPWPLPPLHPKLPSEFLFGKISPRSVPTYLVIEPGIAQQVLRPLAKFAGVRVQAHRSREHLPPHFHVEIPPGKERTRYIWPTLLPMKEDDKLSGKEERKLQEYLQVHGVELLKQLRQAYPDQNLPVIEGI